MPMRLRGFFLVSLQLVFLVEAFELQALQPTTAAQRVWSAPYFASLKVVPVGGSSLQLQGTFLVGGDLTVGLLPGTLDAAISVFPSRVPKLDFTSRYDRLTRTVNITVSLPSGIQLSNIDGAAVSCENCFGPGSNQQFSGLVAQTGASKGFFNNTNVILFSFTNASTLQQQVTLQGRRLGNAAVNTSSTPLGESPLASKIERPATCAVTVGSTEPMYFDFCSFATTNPDAEYRWYATLVANGPNSTTWHGGLEVSVDMVKGQWAGFGFPEYPNLMIGANAVVIRKCGTCASGARVDGYHLTDYLASSKVPGSFPISNGMAAANPDGTLVATFTAVLDRPIQSFQTQQFNYILAVGPLDDKGNLQSHATGGFPYGGHTVQLPADVIINGLPSNQGPGDSSPPAADTAADTAYKECSFYNGNFKACDTLPSGLQVFWDTLPENFTVSGNTSHTGNVTLSFGMAATLSAGQWFGLGFPASPGLMVGSNAMIMSSCGMCPGQAMLEEYFLGGRDTAQVVRPGHLSIANVSIKSGNGRAYGSFDISLPFGSLFSSKGHQLHVIYAAGPIDDTGALQYHGGTRGAATLNLASGTSSASTESSFVAMRNAHAWLMTIGWSFLLLGAVVARSFRTTGCLWFYFHVGLQVVGLILILTAFILIFVALNGRKTLYPIHFGLGVTATSLALAQLAAIVWRPLKSSPWRRTWALCHAWIGRSALVLAVANIYYGIINVLMVESWAVIAYSIVFGSILGLGAVKEGIDYLQLPPPAEIERQFANADEEREITMYMGSNNLKRRTAGLERKSESELELGP